MVDKNNRPLFLAPLSAIDNPSDPDQSKWLDVHHFRCLRLEMREALCIPFHAELDLWVSDALVEINLLPTWLWRPFDLFLETGKETVGGKAGNFRRLRGLATRIAERGPLRVSGTNGRLIRLVLEPDIVILRNIIRCRAHSGKLSDIIEALLRDHPLKDQAALDYSLELEGISNIEIFQKTQYEESDLAFLMRLVEEYGVTWYCDWTQEKPRWIFTDGSTPLQDLEQAPVFRTLDNNGHRLPPLFNPGVPGTFQNPLPVDMVHEVSLEYREHIGSFTGCSLHPFSGARHTADTANARLKSKELEGMNEYPLSRGSRTHGDVPRQGDVHWIKSQNFKDWDDLQNAAMKLEAAREASGAVSGRMIGYLGRPFAGCVFRLEGDSTGTGYLVSACHLVASHYPQGGAEGTTEDHDWSSCVFAKKSVMEIRPAACRFVPARVTPVPRIHGVRVARVTGFADSEQNHPALNRFGSVLLRMDWLGDGDENPNRRWARVCQPWAGNEYGTMFWPRVGNEVAVAFEQGDPDRPIIVGSLYSLWNLPPESADGIPYGWVSGIMSQPRVQGDVKPGMNNFLKILDDRHCQVLLHSVTATYDVSSANSFKITDAGMINVSGRIL